MKKAFKIVGKIVLYGLAFILPITAWSWSAYQSASHQISWKWRLSDRWDEVSNGWLVADGFNDYSRHSN
jgi:hypothetical protein